MESLFAKMTTPPIKRKSVSGTVVRRMPGS